ncbi:hypothetical protein Droror1_Dr00010708 [Drosera rotundifolia]
MYNSEHKGLAANGGGVASPRISFSNDFVEAHTQGSIIRQERVNREGPISTDFEFNVSGYSMITADELFSKGRLLPLKQRGSPSTSPGIGSITTTLRDELLVDDDGEDDGGGQGLSLKPPKGTARWKGLLGLRKTHIGTKKPEKKENFSIADAKRSIFSFDHQPPNYDRKRVQEMMMVDDGGSNDMDMKI